MTALLEATNIPIRIVNAPVGAGKSVALEHYLTHTNAYFLNVRRICAQPAFDAARLFEELPLDVDEIVIDDFDAAPSDAIDRFIERIAVGADRRRYILTGSARQRMRATRLVALGLARIIDGAALAFTGAEIARLADRHGLRYDDEDIAQFLHDTDGWAIAVHWIMRDAVHFDRRLRGAFETWCRTNGHLLAEFVASKFEHDVNAYLAFTMLLRYGFDGTDGSLERYEAQGFPIVRNRASLRPQRVLSRIANAEVDEAPSQPPTHPLMTLKLLGRFRCEIGGRPVKFLRRRDQDVLAFVAVARDGRLTRRQLLEAFWPDVDRDSATQGLRTTLSRIRRALADVCGISAVDAYLRSVDDVCLDDHNVALDVRRFLEHNALGQIAETNDDSEAATRHYAAADRLYADRLLASEAVAPCFRQRVDELEDMYTSMLERAIALHTRRRDHEAVRMYTTKLMRRARVVERPIHQAGPVARSGAST